jgi:hypothetical protein
VSYHLSTLGQITATELSIAYVMSGLVGVLIYRFIAGGPANPFGEHIERQMFYTVLMFGPIGLFMAIVSAIYVHLMEWRVRVLA